MKNSSKFLELLMHTIFQTNLHASQKNKTFGVTVNELIFIGGMLLSAIVQFQTKKILSFR